MTKPTQEERCILRHSRARSPITKMHYGRVKIVRLELPTKTKLDAFITQFGHYKPEDAIATLLKMFEDELGRELVPTSGLSGA